MNVGPGHISLPQVGIKVGLQRRRAEVDVGEHWTPKEEVTKNISIDRYPPYNLYSSLVRFDHVSSCPVPRGMAHDVDAQPQV